jgi:hypothetical protein
MGRPLFFVFLFLTVTAGCATTGGGARTTSDGWTIRQVHKGHSNKEIAWRSGSPGTEWARDSAQTADFAWVHTAQPATIYGDSTCGKKFDDVPLTVLVNHLTFGFEEVATVSQESMDLSGRAGLRRILTASLDGRPIKLASTVVKKGPCIFDLVYVTADVAAFDSGLSDYQAVVDGLSIREGR